MLVSVCSLKFPGSFLAELHLTTVFILIASRLDQGTGNQGRIHEQTWEYMQELIKRLVFGEEVSVGALEALLLLSGEDLQEFMGRSLIFLS